MAAQSRKRRAISKKRSPGQPFAEPESVRHKKQPLPRLHIVVLPYIVVGMFEKITRSIFSVVGSGERTVGITP